MKAAPKLSASETKRLARIRELASTSRRANGALERAIRAALDRGISVRAVAEASGLDAMKVWRLTKRGTELAEKTARARTAGGHGAGTVADAKLPGHRANGSTKPKVSGK